MGIFSVAAYGGGIRPFNVLNNRCRGEQCSVALFGRVPANHLAGAWKGCNEVLKATGQSRATPTATPRARLLPRATAHTSSATLQDTPATNDGLGCLFFSTHP